MQSCSKCAHANPLRSGLRGKPASCDMGIGVIIMVRSNSGEPSWQLREAPTDGQRGSLLVEMRTPGKLWMRP